MEGKTDATTKTRPPVSFAIHMLLGTPSEVCRLRQRGLESGSQAPAHRLHSSTGPQLWWHGAGASRTPTTRVRTLMVAERQRSTFSRRLLKGLLGKSPQLLEKNLRETMVQRVTIILLGSELFRKVLGWFILSEHDHELRCAHE